MAVMVEVTYTSAAVMTMAKMVAVVITDKKDDGRQYIGGDSGT
jgi:hypothetical protein